MIKNLLIFAVIFVIIIVLAYLSFGTLQQTGKTEKTADIKGNSIQLEISDNDPARIKGLSDRDSLPSNKGMLFIFPKAEIYQFWMKNMRFPIDIIYLNDDKVITIYDSVPAFESDKKTPNLTLYSPKQPSNRVLELNAGKAKEFGLQEGDTINFNL